MTDRPSIRTCKCGAMVVRGHLAHVDESVLLDWPPDDGWVCMAKVDESRLHAMVKRKVYQPHQCTYAPAERGA